MRRRRPSSSAAPANDGDGQKRQRTTLLGFAGFSSSSSSTSTSTSALPAPSTSLQLPPLPQWGRLIDEGCVKAARLRRSLQLIGPAALAPAIHARSYTTSYRCPFNDCFNRTPGQGAAGSYGAWGSGVRSALNGGCLGAVAGEESSAGEAMLLIEPGAEEEAEGTGVSRGDSGSSNHGNGKGPQQQQQQQLGSMHRRNFTTIALWALERSGGLIDDPGDVAILRTLMHELSPQALELFLRAFHSPKPIFRVKSSRQQQQEEEGNGSDMRAAVDELVQQGLVLDVPAMGRNGEAIVLMHAHDVLALLRADELAKLCDSLLGPAAGKNGHRGKSRTRDDSLAALDGFITRCVASPFPQQQQHGALRRLGKVLLAFLGGCASSSRFLLVAPTAAKLLRCVYALFFLSSGYEAEDAVVLLRNDVGGLRFVDMTQAPPQEEQQQDGEEAAAAVGDVEAAGLVHFPLVTRITRPFRQLFDHLLALHDAFKSAVQSGDGPLAYSCLHQAANFFLPASPLSSSQQQQPPPPTTTTTMSAVAVITTIAVASASASTVTVALTTESTVSGNETPPAGDTGEAEGVPRWESATEIVDVNDDEEAEEEEDDDDVIVIEPDGPSLASFPAAAASFPSSSSSLSAPVAAPHGSTPRFPPGYRGLQNLPQPLLKLVITIVGRGINLLERERKHAEALHYLQIVLQQSSSNVTNNNTTTNNNNNNNNNNTSEPRPSSLPGLAAYAGHFHTRYIVDLGHMNRPEAQIRACEAALADAGVDGEHRLFAQQKLAALAVPPRRWKAPSFPALRAAPVLQLSLGDLGRRGRNGVGVGKSLEDRVLDCLLGEAMAKGGEQWEGVHAENGVCLTLFGLLCHEVLFAPCDAFVTPFQNAPHDLALGRGTFLAPPSRRAALARCLARIARGEAGGMLEEAYADPQRRGALCVGVDWRTLSLEALQRIAGGLGPAALRLLCETLCEDFGLYSHGLPDLLLWRCDNKPRVRLVEVKGPGDSLSLAQTCWIDKLLRVGVRVEVARVTEAGAGAE